MRLTFFGTIAVVLLSQFGVATNTPAQSASCETLPCDSSCDTVSCGTPKARKHRLANMLQSDCTTGAYLGLHGGWSRLREYNGNDFEVPLPPLFPALRDGSFNDGWLVGGSIGRRINQAIRVEAEFTFRDNTSDQWSVNGMPIGPWEGHFNNFSAMANLFHDFAGLKLFGVTPYVGGGLGVGFLNGNFSTVALDLEVNDEVFAYQGIVGGSAVLTTHVDAFMEYRFYGTSDYNLLDVTTPFIADFGKDPYQSNSMMVGIRIHR